MEQKLIDDNRSTYLPLIHVYLSCTYLEQWNFKKFYA